MWIPTHLFCLLVCCAFVFSVTVFWLFSTLYAFLSSAVVYLLYTCNSAFISVPLRKNTWLLTCSKCLVDVEHSASGTDIYHSHCIFIIALPLSWGPWVYRPHGLSQQCYIYIYIYITTPFHIYISNFNTQHTYKLPFKKT